MHDVAQMVVDITHNSQLTTCLWGKDPGTIELSLPFKCLQEKHKTKSLEQGDTMA